VTIKQTMSTAIPNDPNNVRAVVDEANDGIKAVPVEVVIKREDNSTFDQVNSNNSFPVTDASVLSKLAALEAKLDSILSGASPASVMLTGSNVESAVNFTTSRDMVVTAGSNTVVYSNVDLSKYTHISGIFIMNSILWPHKIRVQWRNSRDSTVVNQELTEIGDAHKAFAPVPVITQRANILVRNEDTVDRRIFTLDVYGHVRG